MAIDTPVRAPATVTVARHELVGRLMDCQILARYADQAMMQAACPENAAPVSVARDALGRLLTILRSEAGRLDGAA